MSFDLDALVGRYKPPHDVHVIEVPGFAFGFRSITDHSEFSRERANASAWAAAPKLPVEALHFRPTDPDTANQIFLLASMSCDIPPDAIVGDGLARVPKLSLVDFARIAHEVGLLFETLWQKYNAKTIYGLDAVEASGVDEAKKELQPAMPTVTDLSSPENAGTSTPTN